MYPRTRFVYVPILFAVVSIFQASAMRADESPQQPPPASGAQSRLFRTDAMYIMLLLKKQPVQSELGLAEKQVKAITELDQARFSELKSLFAAMRDATGPKKSVARKKFEEASATHVSAAREFLESELSEDQQRRLKQIYWQQIGPGAFSDSEVSGVLSLTSDQVTEFAAVQADLQKLRTEDLKKQAQVGNPTKRPGVRIVLPSPEFSSQAMKRLTGVLTEEQRARFTELLGAPFAIDAAPGDGEIGEATAAAATDNQDDRQSGGPE